jgi:hypothetical protein
MKMELTSLRQGEKALMVEHAVIALKEYILGGKLAPAPSRRRRTRWSGRWESASGRRFGSSRSLG